MLNYLNRDGTPLVLANGGVPRVQYDEDREQFVVIRLAEATEILGEGIELLQCNECWYAQRTNALIRAIDCACLWVDW